MFIVYDTYMSIGSIFPIYCIWTTKPKYNTYIGTWEPTEDYWDKFYFNKLSNIYNILKKKIDFAKLYEGSDPIKI